MLKVSNRKVIPMDSLVGKSFGAFNYQDAFCVGVENRGQIKIDEVFSWFTTISPKWVEALMKFRNFLVSFIGLKTGGLEQTEIPARFKVGDKVSVFNVCARTDREIVFAMDDKHLVFESSMFLRMENGKEFLYSITIVKFHNFIGHLYFFFVKPFHKIIIRDTLKRMARKIDKV